MNRRTIRIALATLGGPLRGWEVELVAALQALPHVELTGRMVTTSAPRSASAWDGWLTRRIEQRWTRVERWRPLATPASLQQLPVLDAAGLAASGAEVLLHLGMPATADGPAATAGLERWHFRWRGQDQGLAPTLLERAGADLLADIALWRERPGHAPVVAWSGTYGVRDGAAASIDAVLADMAQWPARALLNSAGTPGVPAPEQANATPAALRDRLRIAFAPLGRVQQERTLFLEAGRWNIGVLYQPVAALLGEHASMNVRWLPPPAKGDHRLAPGGWLDGTGALHTLYARRGPEGESIARLRPRRDNILKRSRILWKDQRTVGWPSVLFLNHQVHAVVGDAHAGTIRLLRLTDDREALEPVAELMDRTLESPVLFPHAGRWWLAGTDPALADERLELYWASNPHGPFTPHAWGAVKTDVRSARPAGTPFVIDGQLFRPSVDATPGQAPRIALNRVLRLDPDGFAEETVRHIGPVQGTAFPHGIRHMAVAGDMVLFDGLRTAEPLTYHQRGRRKKD